MLAFISLIIFVGGGFLGLIVVVTLSYYIWRRVFIKRRTDFNSVKIIPIKYLPDPPDEELPPDPEVPSKPLDRRTKRRINMRKMTSSGTLMEENCDDLEQNRSWLIILSSFFSDPNQNSKMNEEGKNHVDMVDTPKIEIGGKKTKKLYAGRKRQRNHDALDHDLVVEEIAEINGEDHESTILDSKSQQHQISSKPDEPFRFNNLGKVNTITTIESKEFDYPELEDGAGLLDLDLDERRRVCVNRRKALRKEIKDLRSGGIDVVAANSGPPKNQIPAGYEMLQSAPQLTIEDLQFQRVMYLWDSKEASGWYCGTICGASKLPNCNFNIKYDKFETKSVYVDGIINYNLSFSGDQAYGLRWVIIKRIV